MLLHACITAIMLESIGLMTTAEINRQVLRITHANQLAACLSMFSVSCSIMPPAYHSSCTAVRCKPLCTHV